MKTIRHLLIITAILILAWFLRVSGLNLDGFWYDEVFSQNLVEQPSLSAAYQIMADDDHPPLYDLGVMYNWTKLGKNEFFQRFPSAVFGMLTLSVVYILGRAAFKTNVALLSMFLVAISPLHVYYSREARMHALFALFVVFWIYFLFKALRSASNSGPFWLGYAVFGALSIYTHYYAGFTLVAAQGLIVIYLLFNFDAALFKRWLVANIGIVLFFSPWLPTFWRQLNDDPVSHLATVSRLELLKIPAQFFMRPEVTSSMGRVLVALLAYGLLASGGVFLFWTWRRQRSQPSILYQNYTYLLGLALGTFILAFLFSLYQPVIFNRYFLGVLPVTCLLIAFALLKIPGLYLRLLLGSLLVAFSLFSSYRIATAQWRTDYRGVAAHIERYEHLDDTILFLAPEDDPFWTMAFDYYYDGQAPVVHVFARKRDQTELDNTLAELPPHHGVWVIQNRRVAALESAYPAHRLAFREIFHDEMYASWATIEVAYLEFVGEQ